MKLLADRTAVCLEHFNAARKPWLLEHPAPRQDSPSMISLPKFQKLKNSEGVESHMFSQCKLGQKFRKDTFLMGRVSFEKWPGLCDHPSKEWIVPWNGHRSWGPHPPLRGKQCAIPANEWNPTMIRKYEPHGPYLTKETAHYPGLMNRMLAATIALAPKGNLGETERRSGRKRPSDTCHSDLPIPKFKVSRTTNTDDTSESVIGGLRRPFKSVGKVSKLFNLGVQMGHLIRSFIKENPGLRTKYLESIGKAEATHFPGGDDILPLRVKLSQLLCRLGNKTLSDPSSIHESVNNGVCATAIKANFLRLWTEVAEDPGSRLVPWLEDGAPGGMVVHPDLEGLFHKVEGDDRTKEPDELSTNFEPFQNYVGVEDSVEAHQAIQGYITKGYIKPFGTLEECVKYLSGKAPVLSRLGCIVKEKLTDHGEIVSKTRIILDAKQSSITAATRRTFKSELPRVSDAVHDLLDLMARNGPGQTTKQLVADIVDAFWHIPLNPCERKFFSARLNNQYLVFERTAQGSRLAPLTFAAVMALCTRLVRSLLVNARLEVYVDDPWTGIAGNENDIELDVLTLLIGWELIGLPVAYHKAAFGDELKWVGVQLKATTSAVEVSIPADKIQDIERMALSYLSQNLVPDKELRSFIGKVMNIASVIHAWKPFVMQLYAALHSEKAANSPKACTWTSQIRLPLTWILAFVNQQSSDRIIKRVWDLAEYMEDGYRIIITWDASPWGFGAVLHMDGEIHEYFYDQPCEMDLQVLQVKVGESSSQQAFESLCGLIAMRHWSKTWRNRRCTLTIRSDNVGALALLADSTAGRLATT